ncbi:hypothetical protein AIA06_11245 [Salmonella enterica subsp. enterica serovar Derby]|nr:hypothetical protein [Salmonella enterica subsp. enterica serovar Derby]
MGVFILSADARSASRGAHFHGEMTRPETREVALSEWRKTTVYQAINKAYTQNHSSCIKAARK